MSESGKNKVPSLNMEYVARWIWLAILGIYFCYLAEGFQDLRLIVSKPRCFAGRAISPASQEKIDDLRTNVDELFRLQTLYHDLNNASYVSNDMFMSLLFRPIDDYSAKRIEETQKRLIRRKKAIASHKKIS